MAKTIFLLIDGCSDRMAASHLGYLEHLAESGQITRCQVAGELPASSRPMYETLLTGLPASRHGVTSNLVCRKSNQPNIFSLCREKGGVTAAAAYHWVSELYCQAPFDHVRHRIQLKTANPIQHGIFYFEDTYPDSHVLYDGEYLRNTFQPDFLMLHTMNLDDAGHKFGGDSQQMAKSAMHLDVVLSALLPEWIHDGYELVITADHGMDIHGTHGGNVQSIRELPLYICSRKVKPGIITEPVSQLAIAPLLCEMLDIPKSGTMMEYTEKAGLHIFE